MSQRQRADIQTSLRDSQKVPFLHNALFFFLLSLAACAGTQPVGPSIAPPVREHYLPVTKSRKTDADPAGLAHVLRAQYLMHTERVPDSLDELRLALIYDEHSPFLQERLVSALLATDRWNEAQTTLNAGLRDNPQDPGLNLVAGQLALDDWHFVIARGHLEIALADTTLLLTAAPAYLDARLWLNETPSTLQRARALLDDNAGDADLALALAGIYEDHARLDAALDAYGRTRAQRPSDKMAALGEVRVHELLGHPGAAADALVPLLAFYPDQPDLYAELSRLLNDAGRSGAAAYRTEALRLTEGDGPGRAALAAADITMGQAGRGVALLRETIAGLPEAPEPRAVLADWLRQEGQGDACVSALVDVPEGPATLRTRAQCEALRGQTDAVLAAVVRLAEISPEPGLVLADMASLWAADATPAVATARLASLLKRLRGKVSADGLALARAGLFDALGDGVAALTQLVPLATHHPDDIALQLRLADMQTRYGQRRAALTLLEDLVREDPFDAARLNALGFTLADGNTRLSEAAVWLRRALRLSPDDGMVLDSVGWLMLRQGQVRDAVTWLKKAALHNPGDPDVLRHLGDALAAAGARDEARSVYTRALLARPPVPLRRLLKQRLTTAFAMP